MSRQVPAVVVDLVLLFARVAIGIILISHGGSKLFSVGIGPTAHEFKGMGVPAPTASAWYAAIVEFVGGILLIAGVLLPLAAILIFLDMFGAFFTHRSKGIYVSEGGYELVLAIAAAALTLGAVGPGRLSIPGLFGRLRGRTPDRPAGGTIP